jgi:hypothetical protein
MVEGVIDWLQMAIQYVTAVNWFFIVMGICYTNTTSRPSLWVQKSSL